MILNCDTSGASVTYNWKRVSSKPLPKMVTRSNGGKTLTIHNIKTADEGEYYCEVAKGGNSVSSMRVQVIVKSKLL